MLHRILNSSIDSYEIHSNLGSGAYGTIYKGIRLSDMRPCVIKEVYTQGMDFSQREEAENEGELLRVLDHPNIVKFFDSFYSDFQLFIVMEYCENGDLLQFMNRQKIKKVSLHESKIWILFLQMLKGLAYIHSKNILHRDFKTMNMFLTNNMNEVRIGDFGVAKELSESEPFANTKIGTPYFLSPEICEEKPYSDKSDIWSLGCILYQLCTFKLPFEASNQGALVIKILKTKVDPLPSEFSRELQQILSLILTKDSSKRPSALQLLSHPIIQEKLAVHKQNTPQNNSVVDTYVSQHLKRSNIIVSPSNKLLKKVVRIDSALLQGDSQAVTKEKQANLPITYIEQTPIRFPRLTLSNFSSQNESSQLYQMGTPINHPGFSEAKIKPLQAASVSQNYQNRMVNSQSSVVNRSNRSSSTQPNNAKLNPNLGIKLMLENQIPRINSDIFSLNKTIASARMVVQEQQDPRSFLKPTNQLVNASKFNLQESILSEGQRKKQLHLKLQKQLQEKEQQPSSELNNNDSKLNMRKKISSLHNSGFKGSSMSVKQIKMNGFAIEDMNLLNKNEIIFNSKSKKDSSQNSPLISQVTTSRTKIRPLKRNIQVLNSSQLIAISSQKNLEIKSPIITNVANPIKQKQQYLFSSQDIQDLDNLFKMKLEDHPPFSSIIG